MLYLDNKKLHYNYLDFYTGKVEVLKPDKKVEPADIKKKLFLSDIIKTYEASKAYIQFGNDHLVEVGQNTEIAMAALPADNNAAGLQTELNLTKGKIFIIARKLIPGGVFNIKIGTTTVAIRGTIFSIELDSDNLKIDVREGKVAVTPGQGGNATFIEAGEKISISGKEIKKEKMNAEDNSLFSDISSLQPIENIQTATKEYIIDYFSRILNTDNKKKELPDNSKIIPGKKEFRTDDTGPSTDIRLNINTLTSSGIEKNEAEDITKIIYSKIVSSKGKDKVIYRQADGSSKKANRILSGRVSKLGSIKIVSVKVTDVENGKVLFNLTEKINESDSMQAVLENIADKIISDGEIWNRM